MHLWILPPVNTGPDFRLMCKYWNGSWIIPTFNAVFLIHVFRSLLWPSTRRIFLWNKTLEKNCPWASLEEQSCCAFYNTYGSETPGSRPLWSCYTTLLIHPGCGNKLLWTGSWPTTDMLFSQTCWWEIQQQIQADLMCSKNPLTRWLFVHCNLRGWTGHESSLSPLL